MPTNTSDTEVSRNIKKDVYAAEEHPNPTTDNDMSPIADGPVSQQTHIYAAMLIITNKC